MKKVIYRIASYWIFYILFFVLAKAGFYFFGGMFGNGIGIGEFFKAVWHGLPMDLSMASYLTMVCALFYFLFVLTKSKAFNQISYRLNQVVLVALTFFVMVDARLYRYWGFHIESSILEYLKTPKEAAASANFLDWAVVLAGTIILSFLVLRAWKAWFHPNRMESQKRRHAALVLLLMGILIIPLRGGLDVATMSVSRVYYSNENTANHLALNAVWNAAFSLIDETKQPLEFMTEEEAESEYKELYDRPETIGFDTLISSPKNVVVIVLESFTANLVGSIGGREGVTPNLDYWMGEGVSFTNCYSSGDRSDRGLTTLYTGYPALPERRLLSHAQKLEAVPNLYRNAKKQGYHTSFHYGGNIDFANLRLLFTSGKVDDLVTGEDLDDDLDRGKWGVHDGDMYHVFLKQLQTEKQPFLSTLYTLSSHEPFDIPTVSFTSDSFRIMKAVYYADSCFGSFMNQLKKTDLWGNTLVVVTADHGVKNPGNLQVYSPRKYRVPLLLTGGAVKSPKSYNHFVSHTDIPYSIEHLITGAWNKDYLFSKSLGDTTNSQAIYFYNMGAGMTSENGIVVYDMNGEFFVVNYAKSDSLFNRMSKQVLGYTQYASKVFGSY